MLERPHKLRCDCCRRRIEMTDKEFNRSFDRLNICKDCLNVSALCAEIYRIRRTTNHIHLARMRCRKQWRYIIGNKLMAKRNRGLNECR